MFVPQKPEPQEREEDGGKEFDAFAGGFPVPPPMAVSSAGRSETETRSKEGSRG